jgi:putative exosortase-associated protein (TIGR04073 family)
MKTVVAAATALILALGTAWCAFAYETDFDDLRQFDRCLPAWKLGRGFVNLVSGPYELVTHMTNNAINGSYDGAYDGGLQGSLAGGANGAIAGVIPGMYHALKRTTVGALEILTFWKPEYGPTMEPIYGTRNKAFGEQDYFDPDPFWYLGPSR